MPKLSITFWMSASRVIANGLEENVPRTSECEKWANVLLVGTKVMYVCMNEWTNEWTNEWMYGMVRHSMGWCGMVWCGMVCLSLSVCLYARMYAYMHTYMHACTILHYIICIILHDIGSHDTTWHNITYTHIHTCMYICKCICICIYVYVYVDVYAQIEQNIFV